MTASDSPNETRQHIREDIRFDIGRRIPTTKITEVLR